MKDDNKPKGLSKIKQTKLVTNKIILIFFGPLNLDVKSIY